MPLYPQRNGTKYDYDPGLGFVDKTIEAIESTEFLTNEQKADIFYDNAARFLRLTDEKIAVHHKR